MKTNKAKGKFKVNDDKGLHADPSMEIVKCASNFKSEVYLIHARQEVNAKSLLSILGLAAGNGSKIWVKAFGEDAEEAVESILNLDSFLTRF